MSWLLDTNILCQPAKKHGDPNVITWPEKERDHCYTSAIVIAQLTYCIRSKKQGSGNFFRHGSRGWSIPFTGGFMDSTSRSLKCGRKKSMSLIRWVDECQLKTATSRPQPAGAG